MKKILISGASIGGPALAYWLVRYGFEVTVVELAPGLRGGGQAIDVRGPALDVADRMGVLPALRANATGMRGMTMVDLDGNEVFSSTERTITGGDLDSPDVEILRDDLARVIIEAAGDGVEYLFGDSIAALDQDARGVRVTFASGGTGEFDLVVGADGLHSNTRRLAFGPEADFLKNLGTYLAVFTTPNFLELDRWQVFCQVPGGRWGGGVMSVRGNTEARAYLGFQSDAPVVFDHRDLDEQKRVLARAYEGVGWEFPRLLELMHDAPDFHFDAMAQIHMDTWSNGRVALLGDAGYCGSPLSGQGTSMAMVGAYVLAGELKAAAGDHVAAFAAYERELRDYVAANQQLALDNKKRVEAAHAEDLGDSGAGEALVDEGVPDFAEVVGSFDVRDY
ncbi:FAD-dependent monooxygenase [Spirillospora sp. CA-294931]|uniref:FAD-dependent monooxygenase n=1 Tax=Spirillospora sp. CA-294931 TaxID=3240042 RepID=UPI003D930B9C